MKNFELKIEFDEYPMNPREEWDNLGSMFCFHPRYSLGDKHDYKTSDFDNWEDMERKLSKEHNVGVILPLYLYDHSGITISTSPFGCQWDSMKVGYILVSKETIRKGYEVKRITKSILDKVTNCLKGEIETYDQYLTGQVWKYTIMDEDEIVESCSGYYDEDQCRSEGEGMLEYLNKEKSCVD
jgi:hypothetical protein